MPDTHIELAAAIKQLRAQLYEAMENSKDDKLKLRVQEMELELKYTIKQSDDSRFGFKFYVVNASTGERNQNESVQTLKLKLHPRIDKGNGASDPVDLSFEE